MKSVELLTFLHSLDLHSFGYFVESADVVKGLPSSIGVCSMRLHHKSRPEVPFGVEVNVQPEGQVRYELFLYYDKGPKPEQTAVALVELCNESNAKAFSCSSWLVAKVETEDKDYALLVTKSFTVPLSFYEGDAAAARKLHEVNINQFIDDAYYLHQYVSNELCELGIWAPQSNDLEVDDADDDELLPGERR